MSDARIRIGCVIAYAEGHNNYGTSLQGYATLRMVRALGYQPEAILYRKQFTLLQKIKLVVMMVLCGGTSGKLRVVKERIHRALHPDFARNLAVRTRAVDRYKAEKLLPWFREYRGYEALRRGSLNYAAVLVGSDQVWSPMSLYTGFYNLLFVDDSVPKLSYASSFGVSTLPSFQIRRTREYLERFTRIGVREVRGKEIVESISGKQATVVADPTLLLTREEWAEEIRDCRTPSAEPYIFCYLLGTNAEARAAVRELKAATGLKVIAIRHLDEYVAEDESLGDEAPYDVSPDDFVKLISEAEYVCTDSFHCTVFSIIFHRRFMTFYRFRQGSRTSRNSRIDSLLGLLGLQQRLYTGNIVEQIRQPIDYERVDGTLRGFREQSLRFLEDSLKLALPAPPAGADQPR